MADVKEAAAEPSAATPTQYNGWDSKGNPIVVSAPKKEASAASEPPAKEASSEPEGKSAAESGAAKSQERSEGRGKQGAEDRIRELVGRNKQHEEENRQLRERLERLEKGQTKAEPSPAPEPPKAAEPSKAPVKPVLGDFLKKYPGDYERAATEFEEAKDKWTEEMADYKADQKLLAWQQRQAQEAAKNQLQTGFQQAKTRYADFEEKAAPALRAIGAPDVPDLLKSAVGSSDVGWDLVYALGGDQVQKIVELAKVNPAKALLALGAIEAEVRKQLSSKSGSEPAKTTPAGKSEKPPDKPKPSAPPPVEEIGGRAAPPEDGAVAAAKSGDFRSFEAEQNRRYLSGRR